MNNINHDEEIPTGHYFNASEEERKRYHRIRYLLVSIQFILAVLILTAMVFSTYVNGIISDATNFSGIGWIQYIYVYFRIRIIILFFQFPFRIYEEYILEQMYQLSDHSFGDYLLEKTKALLIEFLIAAGFFLVLHLSINRYHHWWLIVSGAGVMFAAIFTLIFPSMIFPLFFRKIPVRNPTLREKLEGIARKAGIHLKNIYTFNLSRKTRKVNAALMGMGKSREVVLGDNLLNQFTEDEIASVFAHECTHAQRHHIQINFLIFAIQIFVLFWITSVIYSWYVSRNHLAGINSLHSFPYLLWVMYILSLFFRPLHLWISRKMEYHADTGAVQLTGDSYLYVKTLEKIAKYNFSDPNPPRLVEYLFLSHPPINKRIHLLKQ